MVTHEIWMEGGAVPVILDLEDDQLFQQFRHWVDQDAEVMGNGWTGTSEGKTWVISFQRVACISIATKEARRGMGFGSGSVPSARKKVERGD